MSHSTLNQRLTDRRDLRRSWLQRIADRLFAEDDAVARSHGWEITELWWGLGRQYRSPLFDTFCRCAACQGTGVSRTLPTPCGSCGGTGRVDLRDDDHTDRAR